MAFPSEGDGREGKRQRKIEAGKKFGLKFRWSSSWPILEHPGQVKKVGGLSSSKKKKKKELIINKKNLCGTDAGIAFQISKNFKNLTENRRLFAKMDKNQEHVHTITTV